MGNGNEGGGISPGGSDGLMVEHWAEGSEFEGFVVLTTDDKIFAKGLLETLDISSLEFLVCGACC